MVGKLHKGVMSLTLCSSFFVFSSQALAIICNDGLVNVKNPSMSSSSTYNACSGPISGNDTNFVDTLNSSSSPFNVGEGTWTLFGKSDDDSFVMADESTAGSWSVDGLSSDTFALGIKASNFFSIYLFEDLGFTAQNGQFTTKGVAINKNNIAQDLSHLSVFEFTSVSAVPIPAAFLLFGSAILGTLGYSFNLSRKKQVSRNKKITY